MEIDQGSLSVQISAGQVAKVLQHLNTIPSPIHFF